MEWQPIDTAPDNEWVLVYDPKFGGQFMMVDHKGWADSEPWMFDPTHWMPLPDPPPRATA